LKSLWSGFLGSLLALMLVALVGARHTIPGGSDGSQTQGMLLVTDTLRVQGPAVFNGAATFNAGTNASSSFYVGAVDRDVDLTGALSFEKWGCTVSGADTTMTATVQPPTQAISDSVIYTARVTSNNQVTITATRTCGASVNPGPGKFRVKVLP